MTKTAEWRVWSNMIQRCTNPSNPRFADYGGRGIKVCSRWVGSLANFIQDMGLKPDNMSLDRIDNDGDYCPENCHWTTASEQNLNKRKYKNNTTGITGVDMYKGRFRVRYRKKHVGIYLTLDDAINARKLAEGN